jgi:hypothetical protein
LDANGRHDSLANHYDEIPRAGTGIPEQGTILRRATRALHRLDRYPALNRRQGTLTLPDTRRSSPEVNIH